MKFFFLSRAHQRLPCCLLCSWTDFFSWLTSQWWHNLQKVPSLCGRLSSYSLSRICPRSNLLPLWVLNPKSQWNWDQCPHLPLGSCSASSHLSCSGCQWLPYSSHVKIFISFKLSSVLKIIFKIRFVLRFSVFLLGGFSCPLLVHCLALRRDRHAILNSSLFSGHSPPLGPFVSHLICLITGPQQQALQSVASWSVFLMQGILETVDMWQGVTSSLETVPRSLTH